MRKLTLGMVALLGLFITITAFSATAQTTAVSLSWDANTEPDLAGYRGYYGTKSQTYTNMTDVGKVTNTIISGLTPGVTYYFAVTAYNTTGLESDYSNEVMYTPPAVPAALAVLSGGPGKVKLRFTYSGGNTAYRVYTNNVLMLTSAATASPATIDLVGIVPGATYLTQVALVDPISGEQPKSAAVSVKLPTAVPNLRRQ